MLEYRCIEMVEELIYGHLRKEQLVTHWEGRLWPARRDAGGRHHTAANE